MWTDPDPDKVRAILDRQRTVIEPGSHRPHFPHLLEMQRGMRRISLQQFEVFSGDSLDRFWQMTEEFPETGGGAMHLQILEGSLGLLFHGPHSPKNRAFHFESRLRFPCPTSPIPFPIASEISPRTPRWGRFSICALSASTLDIKFSPSIGSRFAPSGSQHSLQAIVTLLTDEIWPFSVPSPSGKSVCPW